MIEKRVCTQCGNRTECCVLFRNQSICQTCAERVFAEFKPIRNVLFKEMRELAMDALIEEDVSLKAHAVLKKLKAAGM